MTAADALLDALPRTTLVVGKGGVGKTTCAAALAIRAAERGDATLVLTTDPARALPDVLDHPVGATPAPVAHAPGLQAQALDTVALRADFLARWGDVLRDILDRGTYLDEADIAPMVETALPGGDEIFAALELARLLADGASAPPAQGAHRRLFVDTAPTGHTLRLLELPATFRALVRLLDAMQDKHRYMVRTLTRGYRADAADAFLTEMAVLVTALDDSLRDPRRCAALMVANPQPLVVEETSRYVAALRALEVHVAAIVWNNANVPCPAEALHGIPAFTVARLAEWPTGSDGLHRWLAALRPVRSGAPAAAAPEIQSLGATHASPAIRDDRRRLLRSLTIVAGKGGVGKTTVACALALDAASDHRTLIVSTDPAPSVADAFGQPIADADTPIPGVPVLFARQMDATAAFARLRDEYAANVDALFATFGARGVDLAADRAIARDLLALAPPGIDEVYALSLIADALFDGRFETVVVDPAPTGHLLRMLEMPQLALAWTHQLMRLMLKYRDATGLGETAKELLEFSKRLRALETLLMDADRCGVVLVTLHEPVVLAETERLAREVRARGAHVSGLVLNRADNAPDHARPLPVPDAPMHFEAPAVMPPPAGVSALARWAATWRLDERGGVGRRNHDVR
ncbi:MAG: ArsA family ATPase [Gemmatimonadaceae bacterium]